eukprot:6187115-Pleurochrysis_carterae.AAC.1
MTAINATAQSRSVDCSQLVKPVDAAPLRSPVAVHTVLANRFLGKSVLEIGTRNGDGVMCFAQTAREVAAIDMSAPYCVKLMQRSASLYNQTGSMFSVLCSDYKNALFPRVDYVTWWQEPPELQNSEIFSQLQAMHVARPFPIGSQAIVLFDLKYRPDVNDWQHYRKFAVGFKRIAYNELDMCLSKQQLPRPLCLHRGYGAFIAASFDLTNLSFTSVERQNSVVQPVWRRKSV